MPTVIDCPGCGVPLRLKTLEVLKKGLTCPKCKHRLPRSWPPEDDELLELSEIEVVDDDDDGFDAEPDQEDSLSSRPSQRRSPAEQALLNLRSPGISFREYLRTNRNPIILLIAFVVKVLRIPMPVSSDDPPVSTLQPFEAGFDDFSASARKDIEAAVLELKELGFRNPILHHITHDATRTEYHIVTVRHASGEAIARLEHRHWRGINPVQKKLYCSLITELADGTLLVTTNQAPDLNTPASISIHREPRAQPADLWPEHQQRLAADPDNTEAQRLPDKAAAAALLERHHQRVAEYHLSRGVFTEEPGSSRARIPSQTTPARRSVATAVAPPAERPSAAGSYAAQADAGSQSWGELDDEDDGTEGRHADVLAQIEKQQTGQSSWIAGIVIAVISAGLFIGLGAFQWDWKTVLIILPVLFVHELGHYVAMKIFGYRNLKMFFIPLFGAAVTGRNYNVAGWQKVVVSLAGPVPGIVLGALIGVGGLYVGSDLAIQVAILSLLLNGLNLLPVLPLDGGWIAHSLFFSRHYAIDVTFRVITSLTMLGISLAVGDYFLIGLGVAMLISIPTVLRTGRIVHRLKGELSSVSADEQSIPPATAVRIIDEIEEDFPPAGLNNKVKAQVTLNIFQSMNTAAPGVLGTLLLCAVHGGSLIGALVMIGVLFVGQRGGFNDLMDVVAAEPETSYVCGSSELVQGDSAVFSGRDSEVCVVANCPDAESAAALMQGLSGEVPESGALRLFGQTLLLMLPAGEEELHSAWQDRLEAGGATTMVRSSELAVPLSMQLTFVDEERAKEIHQSLQLYFRSQGMATSLTPPWSPDHQITEEHLRGRLTLWRVLDYGENPDGTEPDDDMAEPEETPAEKEERELGERIIKAAQRGNHAVAERLRERLDELHDEQEERRLDTIRNSGSDVVVAQVVDLYRQRPEYEAPENVEDREAAWERHQEQMADWRKRLGVLLGQLPLTDGEDGRYSADNAFIERDGQTLQLRFLRLHREVDGIAALTDWLCNEGCADIRYQFEDLESGFQAVSRN